MKPFTDADLQRLKDGITYLEGGETEALVDRLVAAEWVITRFHIIPRDLWTSGIDEALRRWLDTKGE